MNFNLWDIIQQQILQQLTNEQTSLINMLQDQLNNCLQSSSSKEAVYDCFSQLQEYTGTSASYIDGVIEETQQEMNLQIESQERSAQEAENARDLLDNEIESQVDETRQELEQERDQSPNLDGVDVGDTVKSDYGDVTIDEATKDVLDDIDNSDAPKEDKDAAKKVIYNIEETDQEKEAANAAYERMLNAGCEKDDIEKFKNDYAQLSTQVYDGDTVHKGRADLVKHWNDMCDKAEITYPDSERAQVFKDGRQQSQEIVNQAFKTDATKGADERLALRKALAGDKNAIINSTSQLFQSIAQFPNDPAGALINVAAAALRMVISISDYQQNKANNIKERFEELQNEGKYKLNLIGKDESEIQSEAKANQEVKEAFEEIQDELKPGETKDIDELNMSVKDVSETKGGIEISKMEATFKGADGKDLVVTGSAEDIGKLATTKKQLENVLSDTLDQAKKAGKDVSITVGKDEGFSEKLTITAGKDGKLSIANDKKDTLFKGGKDAISGAVNTLMSKVTGGDKDAQKLANALQSITKKLIQAIKKAIQKAVANSVAMSNPYTAIAKAVINSVQKIINKNKERQKKYSEVEQDR